MGTCGGSFGIYSRASASRGRGRRKRSRACANTREPCRHAHDVGLLRAVICALFPNLVCGPRRGKRCEFKTHARLVRADLHPPPSTRASARRFRSRGWCTARRSRPAGVYIRDARVPARAVVLRGERSRRASTPRSVKICRGRDAAPPPRRRVRLVRRLRGRLDVVLAAKARAAALDVTAEGGAVVDAVRALIAEEAAEAATEATEGDRGDRGDRGRSAKARMDGLTKEEAAEEAVEGDVSIAEEAVEGDVSVAEEAARGIGRVLEGCGVVFASKTVCFRCGTPRP